MNSQPPDNKKKNSWDETISTIVIALILALTFRSFVFEPFHIPSGSMKDNLLVGDYLFVSKYSYGYSRFSFPFGFPIFQGRMLELHKPERGDVVVFRTPTNTHIDFIKRIIGMPGDHIQVTQGIVYINGSPLKRVQKGDFIDDEDKSNPKTIERFDETLPNGKVIEILKEYKNGTGALDNTQLFDVPPGHYFMMGDNRDNSNDSRHDVGYVPEENIVGHAQIIWFSKYETANIFVDPTGWITSIRPDRIFKTIE